MKDATPEQCLEQAARKYVQALEWEHQVCGPNGGNPVQFTEEQKQRSRDEVTRARARLIVCAKDIPR